MLLKDLRRRIAIDLNDAEPGHELTTWTAEAVDGYIVEALQVTAQNRPELFFQQRTLKIDPCAGEQDLCDCDRIHRVWGQSTESGRVLWPLRERSNAANLVYTGPTCPANPKNFRLREYSLAHNGMSLQVYPQPPAGLELFVSVECVVLPDLSMSDDTNVPDEMIAAVIQWALYRAKSVDTENNPIIFQAAEAHQKTFWTLITEQRRRMREDDPAKDTQTYARRANASRGVS